MLLAQSATEDYIRAEDLRQKKTTTKTRTYLQRDRETDRQTDREREGGEEKEIREKERTDSQREGKGEEGGARERDRGTEAGTERQIQGDKERHNRQAGRQSFTTLLALCHPSSYRVLSGSHRHIAEFYQTFPEAAASSVQREDFCLLDETHGTWYRQRGCQLTKVSVPKSGMVLWDSRLVHDNCRCV